MAPEYALWGRLTYKADVYSFGVVVLEIVAGEYNTKCRPNDDFLCLVDWVRTVFHVLWMDPIKPHLASEGGLTVTYIQE